MSEQGHAKNVAQFSQLITVANGFGPVYNPPNSIIDLVKMQGKLTESQTALQSVSPKAQAEKIAINARAATFAPLSQIVTRVGAAAEVSVADQLFSNDIRTLTRKLQGRRAKAATVDDPLTPDIDESKQSISASQMSFDNRIANFEQLIDLLKASGSYSPNETDLQIPALEALLADMKAKNNAVIAAAVEAKNARIERDRVLYNETEGIIARANLVKKYTKSLFGAASPQYKQVSALRFKKIF
ncbi:MAG: hypothetical protein KIS76_07985 [Pyrinomonadaceae bacterium]|nr:hypothetical protein [Pyrinomonadaceae bacterium]